MKTHFLLEWRLSRGLTQEVLAAKLGMSRTYYTQIENGARDYNQRFLEKAAEALGCSPADIVGRAPTQGPNITALLARLDDAERQRVEAAIMALIPIKEG